LLALDAPAAGREKAPPVYGFEVVGAFPHDQKAFSQGLAFDDGFLYESTGLYGESTLRQVELESGKVLKRQALNRRVFAEGITILDDRILQLTWRNRVGIVYEKKTFKPQGTFRYTGEGWGITTDGKRIFVSDGSATLRLLDPKSYEVVGRINVQSRGIPVDRLNELEYVDGEIYANVWTTDYVVRISPATGQVLGWIDLRGLLKPHERPSEEAVLNGIAYDPKKKRLFVTGKLWPKLFEIRLVRKGG
jgi:glutamine cyclotransferase